MSKRVSLLSVFSLSLACHGPLSAFYSLRTENVQFLGRDVIQAEVGFEHIEDTDGADYFANALLAEFSYGLWDKLDILLSAPWQGWNSGGLSESGLGDVSLEAKFWAAERRGWDLALKPGFSLPAGNEAKSLGAGEGHVWLYGIAGRADGPRLYHFNAGYLMNNNSVGEEKNIFSASVSASSEIVPELSLGAELSARTNKNKGVSSHPVCTSVALLWSPAPSLDLDAGIRIGLNDVSDEVGLLLGATIRFD